MTGQDIHDKLDEVISGLSDKSIDTNSAHEITNAVGKKINLWGLQFKYAVRFKKEFDGKLLDDKESK